MTDAFTGTAFSASNRHALATEVVGTVYVTKAGGTKEIRVFDGMAFEEGDLIHVGKGGSLTLKVADRDDAIVLGENWNGTLSKLRGNASGATETAIHTWSGSMMNRVQKLSGTGGSYQVETPTSAMGVQGTHFLVGIDPVLGSTYAAVLSGKVAVTPTASDTSQTGGLSGTGRMSGITVGPAQQVEQIPQSSPAYNPIDPEKLIGLSSEAVVAGLIGMTGQIDEENHSMNSSYYKDSIQMIINQSNSLLSQEEIRGILDRANPDGSAAFYEPNRPVIAPVNPFINDPGYLQQQKQQEEAKAKLQQKVAAKSEAKQGILDSNQALIQQITQRMQEQSLQNEKLRQEKQQEAIDRLLSELSDAQRRSLEQRIQQLEEEKKKQEQVTKNPSTQEPTTKQPIGGSSGGGITGGGSSGPSRLATSTSIRVEPNPIYAGEPFVLTANVTISQSNQTVSDGTSVTFRKGTQAIATGTTQNGAATARISSEESLALFGVGDYSLNAQTAETPTTQMSTSFPAALKVKQDETTTAISAPHREVFVGETVPFTVSVTPQHGHTPAAGSVKLYENDKELDSKELNSDGTVTFDVLIEEPASDVPRTYKAVFAGTEKLSGSEGALHLPVSHMNEIPAFAYLRIDRISPTQLNAVISLDRFTGDSELYRAEFEFVHARGVEPRQGDGITYYNAGKFQPSTVTEAVYVTEGEHDGAQVNYTEYHFETITGGATFDTEEVLAVIPFTVGDSASGEITVIAWRFFDRDGNAIEVRTD
ncbi:hypothetical protein [Paenibacillus macerans]|uniref:hypothetical protein n=1 Tax=Paenibacillus macerans TaxID=44252 RepID=UPI003D3198D1